MAQTTYPILNSTGAVFRQRVNEVNAAIKSSNSGSSAPSDPVAGMLWLDTDNGVLFVRNGANDAWLPLFAQFASQKNLIINGSGRVNQRGYVSGTATAAANQYTLDRWRVVVSGENLTFTGTSARRVMTAPAGGVEQVIDGVNIVGGTYVLNWDGTATATVDGTARAKGETFTLTANTNATVRFTSGTFTDVQLELGLVVTPFEFRDFGVELDMCQVYFESGEASYIGANAVRYLYVPFKKPKRATPTITRTGNGPITSGTAGTVSFSPQTHGFYWFQSATTNSIGGDWTAESEL